MLSNECKILLLKKIFFNEKQGKHIWKHLLIDCSANAVHFAAEDDNRFLSLSLSVIATEFKYPSTISIATSNILCQLQSVAHIA